MISEGSVEVIIDGEVKKTLKKGDYFGDLALLYNAPRTASIRCVSDTTFWTIHRRRFQMLLKNIKTTQFRENKKIVEKVKIFGKKNYISNFKDNLTG